MNKHLAVTDVLDKLAAFGSARQIADHLVEQGCRGHRSEGKSCPVSRYVLKTTGETVDVGSFSWNPVADYRDENPTPLVVGEFVRAFDRRAYPELILLHDGAEVLPYEAA